MPRVKRGVTTRRRHNRLFKLTKGFRGKRRNTVKLAKNAAKKAGMNAYRDRHLKKRFFSQLWVLRINAGCREHGIKYSRFIYGLELAGVELNRKMLSELATNDQEAFKAIVEKAKQALPPDGQAPDLEALRKLQPKAEKVEKVETTEKKAATKARAKKAADKKTDKKVAKKK
jgi:large subunit ribosomal protein L20